MQSKLKNTLTGLLTAAAFLAAGALLGEPVRLPVAGEPDSQASVASVTGRDGTGSLSVGVPMRLRLTMPYLSLPRIAPGGQES